MKSRFGRDWQGVTGAIIFTLIGLLVLYFGRNFSDLGSVFPNAIGSLMVFFSVVYAVVSLVRPSAGIAPETGSLARRVLLVATMFAWALLLNVLGFLSSSVLAFALLLAIANYDRWTWRMGLVYLLLGVVLLGGMYLTFRYGLKVPLPTGALI